MIELIPLFTALFKIAIAMRIVAFTSADHKIKRVYSYLAVIFVAYFLGSAVSILVNGQLVTLSELILTILFAVLVMLAQGNIAALIRGFVK